MKITQEQEDILARFTCQRLTSDPTNKEKIKEFSSAKGAPLVAYLQNKAWQEDSDGSTAYYVIKNPDGLILLFFSLKCGALFDPLDESELRSRIASFNELLAAMQVADGAENGEGKAEALELIESLRSGLNITFDQFRRGIKMRVKHDTQMLEAADADRAQERNEKIVRVGKTYPGVELVHFCSNDNAKDYWRGFSFCHPMGEVLFWYYIAPIIFDIQILVGCQYVFLFAADASPDGNLVNYYEVALKFLQPDNVGTNKPRYDFCCEFMCQTVNDLRMNKHSYFEYFNPDTDEDII
ncbi:MAG: hypothetical protein E7467_03150 [Ruminococcaceae bacterium]|nr:hypothetical protein [Oscillospiraceae bacterium]